MVSIQQKIHAADSLLSSIERWDGWDAIQKGAAKEYGIPEWDFYTILPEYQKFMGLIALGYKGLGMWSQKVDLVWHAHILNTQRYENFCRTIIGEMVHHVPCCDMQGPPPSSLATLEPKLSCTDPSPSCKEPDPGPLCREPDPNPSCGEPASPSPDISSQIKREASGAVVFSALYTHIYGRIPPPEIWDFTGADGQAT